MLTAAVHILEHMANWSRPRKQLAAVLIDIGLCVLAVVAAVALRVGIVSLWDNGIARLSLLGIALFVPIFAAMGVYRAIFRYAGRGMIANVIRAWAIYAITFGPLVLFLSSSGIPRTVVLIQPILFVSLIITSRLVVRYVLVDILGRLQFSGERKRMLIYGAGDAGQQIAGSMANDGGIQLIGYIDDDDRLKGRKLDGFPVFAPDEIESVVARHGVTDILLALPSRHRTEKIKIVKSLERYSAHVQTLPDIRDIVDGRVSINDIRELEIDDLLGREAVAPNQALLGRTIVDQTVLVSGAGGSIGSELCRQVVQIGARRIILLELNEFALYNVERSLRQWVSDHHAETEIVPLLGSVQDEARLEEVFALYTPQTVFHAAAYKHVPLVEANPIEAIRNNVQGTERISRASLNAGVENFILVSTDKAVRPTNVMGATKRAAELVVQALADEQSTTRFSIVRFGNVLGSSGSVVPLFRAQIAQGGPITLTHNDVTRYFMTIPEAALLVIQAGGLGQRGEVFVLDMGEPVKIRELAETMIRLSGLTVRDALHPDGDIEIREVGMRPGEKLIEELLIGENPQSTEHPRIMMAQEDFIPARSLFTLLERLFGVRDGRTATEYLGQIVPEFKHAPRGASAPQSL